MARTWAAVVVSVWTVLTCEQELEPAVGGGGAVEWVEYESAGLGLRLTHPGTWRVKERGRSIRFEGSVATAMTVTLTDGSGGRSGGSWGRTRVVRVETAGVLAYRFYRYRHYDGPAYVPVLAFVVRHRGAELGIEFRTRAEEPGPVERRILASVRLIRE